ncbi:hypothetical protein Tco_0836509 [Tanacetum coccineum]
MKAIPPHFTIILPKQLFIDLTNEDTKTPSLKLQLSSPSVPNAPFKTPSTKGTSSSPIDYTLFYKYNLILTIIITSQENNHPNQELPDPYIKDTPTSPQVASHPPFPISPINSYVTHTQSPPQSDNQIQHTLPPSLPTTKQHSLITLLSKLTKHPTNL